MSSKYRPARRCTLVQVGTLEQGPPPSCPVRRIPRQDPLLTTVWGSLTNGWYTIIPKDKVKFIEIEWWQSFHYIYQLHCIWQDSAGLWYIGFAIRYTIMLLIYVHHGAPFCVLTVKRHCLPLTRLPRVAGGAPAVNHKATAIWLALRILAGNEHCNVCDGNMVSGYIFNFFYGHLWMNASKICLSHLYLFVLYPCQILQAYKP